MAAIVSFLLALANGETGLTAFLEPFVSPTYFFTTQNGFHLMDRLVFFIWVEFNLETLFFFSYLCGLCEN